MLYTKYEKITIKDNDYASNVKRLTNQLWKLIPMREHEEDWTKQLETVILEVTGLNELLEGPSFLQLLSKLEALLAKKDDVDFELYRKTIFECISILQGVYNGK